MAFEIIENSGDVFDPYNDHRGPNPRPNPRLIVAERFAIKSAGESPGYTVNYVEFYDGDDSVVSTLFYLPREIRRVVAPVSE